MPGQKDGAGVERVASVKVIEVVFYQSETGNEPVRDWLLGLFSNDRKLIGTAIKEVEYGWPIGLPLVRKMSRGLWEVRRDLTDKKTGRVLFTVDVDTHPASMVLLHGFVKKAKKTPHEELETAKKRLKDYMAS